MSRSVRKEKEKEKEVEEEDNEMEDVDGEDDGIVSIDRLQSVGINAGKALLQLRQALITKPSLQATSRSSKSLAFIQSQESWWELKRYGSLVITTATESWHISDQQDLAQIKGLSEAKVDKLIEACSKLHVRMFK